MKPEAPPFAHAVLMPAVRHLHEQGFESVFFWSAFSPSGMSLRWQVSVGPLRSAQFMQHLHEPLGLDTQVPFGNHVSLYSSLSLQSTDALDAASIAMRLLHTAGTLRTQRARAPNEAYVAWFAKVCDALLPDYTFYLFADWPPANPAHLPVTAVRPNMPQYGGGALDWPPGYQANHAQ